MAVFFLWIFGRSGVGWVSVLVLGGGVLGVEVLGHGGSGGKPLCVCVSAGVKSSNFIESMCVGKEGWVKDCFGLHVAGCVFDYVSASRLSDLWGLRHCRGF